MYIKGNTKDTLDVSILQALSESFGLDILSCEKINNGNMKDTYLIASKTDKYVAQRFKYGDFYCKKFNFINTHLRQLEKYKTEIEYPKFLTTSDEQYFVHEFTLQKVLPGEVSVSFTLEKAYHAALALREFHSFAFNIDEEKTIWERRDPTDYDGQILAAAKEYGYGVIHGEFRLRNMLFAGDKPSAILDFDSLCYASRYHDIAYLTADFIEHNSNNKEAFIENIHQAYSNGECDITSAYASLLIHYLDYIKKCETGFMKNNKPLSLSEIKELITFLEERYYEYIR